MNIVKKLVMVLAFGAVLCPVVDVYAMQLPEDNQGVDAIAKW